MQQVHYNTAGIGVQHAGRLEKSYCNQALFQEPETCYTMLSDSSLIGIACAGVGGGIGRG